jgi:hypothetical protein
LKRYLVGRIRQCPWPFAGVAVATASRSFNRSGSCWAVYTVPAGDGTPVRLKENMQKIIDRIHGSLKDTKVEMVFTKWVDLQKFAFKTICGAVSLDFAYVVNPLTQSLSTAAKSRIEPEFMVLTPLDGAL